MRTIRIAVHGFGALLALLLGATVSLADACRWDGVETASDARRRLNDMRVSLCLIPPSCDFPLCRKVGGLAEHPTPEQVSAVLAEIRDSVGVEIPDGYPGKAAMQTRLSRWVERVLTERVDALAIAEWKVDVRTLFADEPDELRFGGAIESRMAELSTTASQELVLAATQLRLALLVEFALHRALAMTRAKSLAQLERLDRRWESYFADSRALYPWERLADDFLFGKDPPADGFEAPRNQQLLFLHPDASLQYATIGDERLSETLVLELLGIYRWGWTAKDKVDPRLSGSAFLGWRGNTQDDPYWGLMAHLPKGGSLGLGHRRFRGRKEWVIFASADAGKLFLKNSNPRADKIREEIQKLLPAGP